MTSTTLIEIDAIFEDGLIRPLQDLDIPNNAPLKIQVRQLEKAPGSSFASFKGILAGKENFDLEDVETRIRYLVDTHTEILADRLDLHP